MPEATNASPSKEISSLTYEFLVCFHGDRRPHAPSGLQWPDLEHDLDIRDLVRAENGVWWRWSGELEMIELGFSWINLAFRFFLQNWTTSHYWAFPVPAPPYPRVGSTMPVAKKSSRTQWPPVSIRKDETGEETRQRLKDEAEAKHRSDMIDRQLDHERQQKSKVVGAKILLLGSYHVSPSRVSNLRLCLAVSITVGQAESGKSTVLKNFQLHFAPKAFELEVLLKPPTKNTILTTFSGWDLATSDSP